MFADYPAFDIDLVTDNIVSGRLSLETSEKIDSIIAEEVIQAEKFSIACIGDSEDDEDESIDSNDKSEEISFYSMLRTAWVSLKKLYKVTELDKTDLKIFFNLPNKISCTPPSTNLHTVRPPLNNCWFGVTRFYEKNWVGR